MIRWLELVDRTVCRSLALLIEDQAAVEAVTRGSMPRTPVRFRTAMAGKHARLVDIMIERKGTEAGVREGRAAMHAAGIALGKRLRSELRLTDSEDDLFAAARLLYRILGIEFEVERNGEKGTMLVRRCALSEHYTQRTCEVISAMDEGVVMGLNPGAKMTFVRRNSTDPCACEAVLIMGERR
jgi:hypothetical protein